MLGFVKDNFLYIKCPKNGCMTYSTFLESNGWNEINLFENDLDFDNLVIWGHLTEPHSRHTRGVEQYLKLNPDLDISNPSIAKMLVSGVFDEHTYSLHMMLGKIMQYPIHWIPLDTNIIKYNAYPTPCEELIGDDLTNDFFKEHNIELEINQSYRLNVSVDRSLRIKIDHYKELYHDNYQKLVKNFLEPDLLLYNNVVNQYRKKYELAEQQ
jgi:hypothetical protein